MHATMVTTAKDVSMAENWTRSVYPSWYKYVLLEMPKTKRTKSFVKFASKSGEGERTQIEGILHLAVGYRHRCHDHGDVDDVAKPLGIAHENEPDEVKEHDSASVGLLGI